MPDPSSIRKVLDLSTAHLSPPARDWLDGRGRETANRDSAAPTAWVASTPTGWLVYADESLYWVQDEVPLTVVACMSRARELGVEYILFDADAPTDEELPTYEDPDELVGFAVSKPALDAIQAGLFLLATSMRDETVRPNEGSVGQTLTNDGQHAGLTVADIDNLADELRL